MGDLIRQAFDSANARVELYYLLAALGCLVFFGLAIYSVVVKGAAFDPGAYGQGLGYTFAGVGAASWGTGLGRKAQGAAAGPDGNAPPA